MDGAGLALGIPGFIVDSFELHDRWGSAKNFRSEFDQAIRTWIYSNQRRQAWINYAGFDGQTLKDTHHARLDDPNVRSGAQNCFETISEVSVLLDKTFSKMRIDSAKTEELHGQMGSLSTKPKTRSGATSMRGMTAWSLHGKQFIDGVARYEKTVERLFTLVPEAGSAVAGSSAIQGGTLAQFLSDSVTRATNSS